MTPQDRMKAKLSEMSIPFKTIEVYGSQIVITTYSESSARKWVQLIGRFAAIRGVLSTTEDAKENRGTCLIPSQVDVWRVYARVK